MAAPSHVFTITRVAKMLGEDEAWLEEIAMEMEPEDGRVWIRDVDDDYQVTAFTPFGVERRKELIERSIKISDPRLPESSYPAVLTACLPKVVVTTSDG